ncbi:helix-turn-helix domain-containing protein [Geminicoccus flavidas]|uniref:helix-turn-helix domain-containing protein n=1 Tax=Geminicoccus flavidas TaxID=2506407 RepID=UPI00190F9DA4|nr:helix-turn-helix domain-containing protein [Geminicoccus flavidas]
MVVSIKTKASEKNPVAPAPVKPAVRQGRFFTVADLARRWSMLERHIRRLIDQGHLVVHRIGRSVRIAEANVALFEARCTRGL